MHVRRVLLLFAIVLGLAALAASISPRDEDRVREDRAIPGRREASPRRPAGRTVRIRFDARAAPVTRSVARRTHVVLRVLVPEPGQVTIAGLDQALSADAGTPAVFDLLPAQAGRFQAAFVPADGDRPRTVGTLAVR